MQPAREGSPRRKIDVWGSRPQFLPQPGFLLSRMQHAQGRPSGPGFSAHYIPPGAPDARGTRRTPSRLERPRRRQAPPCSAGKWKIEIGKGTVERPHPCMKQTRKDGPPKGDLGIKARPPPASFFCCAAEAVPPLRGTLFLTLISATTLP